MKKLKNKNINQIKNNNNNKHNNNVEKNIKIRNDFDMNDIRII